MVTRKDLQNFRNDRLEVSLLRRQIAELEDLTLVPDISQWGGALKDKAEAVLAKKGELKALYIERLHELLEKQVKIENWVSTLEGRDLLIIKALYFEGLSWAQTADRLNLSAASRVGLILKQMGL